VEHDRGRIRRVKHWQAALAIVAALSASLALAEDFRTINGKEYKNVEVGRVEPDGIVLFTKSGISKVYFTELPKEVADKWLAPVLAAQKAAEEKRIEAQNAAQREREAKEKKATAEREEKEGNAEADLKRRVAEFQAAEQRASKACESAAKGTLSGQVFVSTVGGENFKLGAVQIGLFARDAIDALLPAVRKYADFKIQGGGDASEYSGGFYLALLDSPIRTAETDADGRFVIEVPQKGAFVIGAQANRRVVLSTEHYTEHYYWLQPISLEGKQQLTQNLSNNNLTSTTGSSSLIHTQD
jgi:hypothetical protein